MSLRPENAKEIRALILELAIRGRLTEDWRREHPDVEPASLLLERIRAEKLRLVEAKVIRKEREQPLLEESEIPYPIPSTWQWCRLGDYIRNFGQKKPDQKFTYIDVGSIDNDKGIITGSTNDLNSEEAPSRARKIVEHGTVIYSTVRPYLLNIAIVSRDFEHEPIASTAFAILHPMLGCPPEYLYTLLRSPYFIEYVESKMKGVAYPAINDKQMMAGLVPTPPLPEQKAIVTTVNRLLAEVDELEKQTTQFRALRQDYVTASLRQLTGEDSSGAWAALRPHFPSFFDQQNGVDRLREAILELAVQGKLTAGWRAKNPDVEPASVLLERIGVEKARLVAEGIIRKEKLLDKENEYSELVELPGSWTWVRLGQISTFLNGYAFKSSTYVKESDHQIIRLGNVKNEGILIDRKQAYIPEHIALTTESFLIKEHDLLTTLTGTKGKRDYGFVSIVTKQNLIEKNLYLNQRVGCIRTTDSNLSQFLNYSLKSLHFLDQVFESESGTANQGNISSTVFRNSSLPLPPLAEQKAIVKVVDSLLDYCDQLQERITQREAVGKDFLSASVRELLLATEKAEA